MNQSAIHPLTQTVLDAFSACPDARLKRVMTSLVEHLHAFAIDVQLTGGEWRRGIEFLTATGKQCEGIRQEFVLLSDTLGLSIVVDAINQGSGENTTESSLLGPFYREGAKEEGFCANIARTEGEPALIHGRVVDEHGKPVAGALIEVWQTANNGMYEGQDPDQPESNLRAKFRSGEEGQYAFRTIKPTSYPIPTDGPVGQMLLSTGRHPMRPGHIHFMIDAHGYDTLTTALYSAGDPYIGSDAVFGAKPSLVIDYVSNRSAADAKQWGLESPFYEVRRDLVLCRRGV